MFWIVVSIKLVSDTNLNAVIKERTTSPPPHHHPQRPLVNVWVKPIKLLIFNQKSRFRLGTLLFSWEVLHLFFIFLPLYKNTSSFSVHVITLILLVMLIVCFGFYAISPIFQPYIYNGGNFSVSDSLWNFDVSLAALSTLPFYEIQRRGLLRAIFN